jgi:hypothetical protein
MPNIKLPDIELPKAGKPLPLWRRLGWFFGLWVASAAAVAVFAYGLKAIFGL